MVELVAVVKSLTELVMKKLILTMLAGVLMTGAAAVYAGGGCCGGDSAASGKSGKTDMFASLKLTDDQKAKVAKLQADCLSGECTSASRDKFMKGVESILTADQLAQFKAACANHGKGSCPMSSGAAKTDKPG